MKNVLPIIYILVIFGLTTAAQSLPKPTLLPTIPTAAQQTVINDGAKLHDQKKYDEAIAKYEAVLADNPDCTLAMYELALSQYTKGDKAKASVTAYRGTKYKSDQLPLFYGLIANVLDDNGKDEDAIKLYREAEKMLKADIDTKRFLASIYYNLGITYARQKKYAEARTELKNAVEHNFSYASPHYLLAYVFNTTKYKVPAFLAASRLLTLEFTGNRATQSAAIIKNTLSPTSKDEKTGNINIFLDINAPKDEGDFGMYDLILATLTTVKDKKDEKKSDNEIFADAIDTVVGMLAEDKKLAPTFVGKTYIPFMAEMKKKGYTKPFAYLVLHTSGNPDALEWIKKNNDQMVDMVNWARAYQLSGQ